MAHCFRHFATKFASLSAIITPRNHVIKCEKPNLFCKNNSSEQYSTQIKCKALVTTDHDFIPDKTSDNRECSSDVVTKQYIFHVENADSLKGPLSGRETAPPVSELYFHSCRFSTQPEVKFSESPESNKPSPEGLSRVYDVLMNTLPNFFTQPLDYSVYHPEVVFENNIRGTTTVGLYNYIKQLALLRTVAHLKFAYVNFEVLKITKHPEDSTVKVRWRIRGVTALRVMLNFWKYKLWNVREIFERADTWYDGFSTFHVNAQGEIYKHVADKMMPDSDAAPVKASVTPLDAAKLALITGLIPKCSDIYSIT